MRRREFIAIVGGAAAWPAVGRAQPAGTPVIGFLHSQAPGRIPETLAIFRQGLVKMGFVEGKNLKIEYRWAENHFDRLPSLALDLVHREVDLVVTGSTDAAFAAKTATAAIPIVFVVGTDPVKLGLVANLNSPSGNLTGATFIVNSLVAKQLETLRGMIPNAKTIGLLVDPKDTQSGDTVKEIQATTNALGLNLVVAEAGDESDFEQAFAILSEQGVEALMVPPTPFFNVEPVHLVELVARHQLPAIYGLPQYARGGGLMSYGTSNVDAWRLAGEYAGRILKGAKPGDLPVQQSTKVELVINMKAAEALGITFPITLLGRADEVIE